MDVKLSISVIRIKCACPNDTRRRTFCIPILPVGTTANFGRSAVKLIVQPKFTVLLLASACF